MRKLVELLIDEETNAFGVEAISLVKYPAIEHNWVFFSKDKRKGMLTLASVDEAKRTIVGPALIPLKEIPRYDDDTDEEYDVYFSEETVVRASELFLKTNRTNEHTFEHETDIEGVSVVESWIVTDPEMDKSNLYNMEVPKGTWMVRLKVDNDEIWDEVRTGTVKGLSIEGYFVDRVAEMKRQDIQPTKEKEELTEEIELENPCWDGYEMIGTKMKDGKEVPNCVPLSVKMSLYQIAKELFERLKPTKMYAEISLMDGRQLVTEDESIALGALVYSLDDKGEPEAIVDGEYTTQAEIQLTISDGKITTYDGESLYDDEEIEEEEITGDGKEELMTKYKDMYNKKLSEIQASKTSMSNTKVGLSVDRDMMTLIDSLDGEVAMWMYETYEQYQDGELNDRELRDAIMTMVENDRYLESRDASLIMDFVDDAL